MITIKTASWGNTDRTAAIVNTVERGHKAISEHDTPEAWADFQAWIADGNSVRALEDGTAFKERERRAAELSALRLSAAAKLQKLDITADELRAILIKG